jgi:hypothetical protein
VRPASSAQLNWNFSISHQQVLLSALVACASAIVAPIGAYPAAYGAYGGYAAHAPIVAAPAIAHPAYGGYGAAYGAGYAAPYAAGELRRIFFDKFQYLILLNNFSCLRTRPNCEDCHRPPNCH